MVVLWLVGQFAMTDLLHKEDEHDRQVLKVLAAMDQAVTANKKGDLDAAMARVKQLGGRAALDNILKLTDPLSRALAVEGYRLLPVRAGWNDLQIFMVDRNPVVRQQVLLYAARWPQGLGLTDVQMALQDLAPEVRVMAVQAIIHVAKKPREAAAALRQRLPNEKDPAVVRAIRVGLTALGERSQ
jgi:hypothetical protein